MSKDIPFTTRHEATLEACAQTLAEHTIRFDAVDEALRQNRVVMEALDSKLDVILEVFEHNSERLKKQESLNPRVDHLETRMEVVESHFRKDT